MESRRMRSGKGNFHDQVLWAFALIMAAFSHFHTAAAARPTHTVVAATLASATRSPSLHFFPALAVATPAHAPNPALPTTNISTTAGPPSHTHPLFTHRPVTPPSHPSTITDRPYSRPPPYPSDSLPPDTSDTASPPPPPPPLPPPAPVPQPAAYLSADDTPRETDKSVVNAGAVVGVAIGGVVMVALVATVAFIVGMRKANIARSGKHRHAIFAPPVDQQP